MSLKSQVFAITGAGQGIALATARLLASRGASVSLADMNPNTLAEVEKEFHANDWSVLVTVVDVRKRKDVDDWINATVQKFGRLDGAANIAGIIGKQIFKAQVTEIEDDDWEMVMSVNVTGTSDVAPSLTTSDLLIGADNISGTMNSMRAELKHLVDGGSIVNVSSQDGSRGVARCSAYCTSKHAVLALTRCAAREYGSRGIRVNTVGPGATRTPLFDSVVQGNPPPPAVALERYGEPEEIAYAIAWLLGPESKFATGELFRIDGGEFC
jgi:NAD(P)-dependent dehydrogenase (short-subunit alcohol dehydrogenase family)